MCVCVPSGNCVKRQNFWKFLEQQHKQHELESYSSVSSKFKPYGKTQIQRTHTHTQGYTHLDIVINRYICIWGQGQSRWRQVDTADSNARNQLHPLAKLVEQTHIFDVKEALRKSFKVTFSNARTALDLLYCQQNLAKM